MSKLLGSIKPNAVWAGPVSAPRWVPPIGLCSRWEAGYSLEMTCCATGLVDCTVGIWGFYADLVSPAALFDIPTGNLPGWQHPLAHD